MLDAAPGTALDVEPDGILAVRPGTGYVLCRVKVGALTYLTGRMQVTVTDEAPRYTVICRTLNIRGGAGTGNAILGKLKRGAEADITEISGGWGKLKSGGWVAMEYLHKI